MEQRFFYRDNKFISPTYRAMLLEHVRDKTTIDLNFNKILIRPRIINRDLSQGSGRHETAF